MKKFLITILKVIATVGLLICIGLLFIIEWNHGQSMPLSEGLPICAGMVFCSIGIIAIWNLDERWGIILIFFDFCITQSQLIYYEQFNL